MFRRVENANNSRRHGLPAWAIPRKYGAVPPDFKSDGCTRSPDFDFSLCCEKHDEEYSDPESTDRAAADLHLRECIAGKGHRVLAWFYWAAVRLFGGSHWRADAPLSGKVDAAVGRPIRAAIRAGRSMKAALLGSFRDAP